MSTLEAMADVARASRNVPLIMVSSAHL